MKLASIWLNEDYKLIKCDISIKLLGNRIRVINYEITAAIDYILNVPFTHNINFTHPTTKQ